MASNQASQFLYTSRGPIDAKNAVGSYGAFQLDYLNITAFLGASGIQQVIYPGLRVTDITTGRLMKVKTLGSTTAWEFDDARRVFTYANLAALNAATGIDFFENDVAFVTDTGNAYKRSALGTWVIAVNYGDLIAAGAYTAGANITITDKVIALATNVNIAGTFAVATNKFNVNPSNGNTTLEGTLTAAVGILVGNKFSVDTDGDVIAAGTLGVGGVATIGNDLLVAQSEGNNVLDVDVSANTVTVGIGAGTPDGKLKVNGQAYTPQYSNTNMNGNKSLNMNNSNVHWLPVTGTGTLTVTNVVAGASYIILIKSSGTPTITFDSNVFELDSYTLECENGKVYSWAGVCANNGITTKLYGVLDEAAKNLTV